MANRDLRRRVFLEVQESLPRGGPGDKASTERALAACGQLPATTRVLDVGCGCGLQTLHLAERLPGAVIVAVDRHGPYLSHARARFRNAGMESRLFPVLADMRALPVADDSIDLLWCEGAAYVMGLGQALGGWRPLLACEGRIAFTEAVWLTGDAPSELARWWRAAYPQMRTRTECLELVDELGYRVIDTFVLPPAAWWDDYYLPMEARVGELRARYRSEPVALDVLAACQHEIDNYRRWSDCYGYLFVIASRDDG